MKQPATISTFYRNYEFDGITYKGIVKVKRIRSNLRYSLHYEKKELHITIRPEVSLESLDKFIISSLPGLINRVEKRRKNELDLPDDEIYLLGVRNRLPSGMDRETYLKSNRREIVKHFEFRVREFERKMGIHNPYKVRGEIMKTRYGSNSSQTHSISLDLKLYQFSEDVIDSVVVHELAHDTFRNHGKRFYHKVLTYCPNYWELRKRLLYRLYNQSLAEGKGLDNTPMEETDDE